MKKNKPSEKKIGSILNNLIRSDRFSKDSVGQKAQRGATLTTLGVPLIEQEDGRFFIDLTHVRFFTGIPGFVSYLAKQTLEKCRKSTTDVLTQTAIDANSTPELAALGVGHVVVYARGAVARYIVEDHEHFFSHLRLVFDALQTPQWGKLLFPASYVTTGSHEETDAEEHRLALHFPLQNHAGHLHTYFFLVEYDPKGRFLRITVEDTSESRLFLKRIPHRVVKGSGKLYYQQDISSMVKQIFTGIHRECQNQQNDYTEIPSRQPALFELLLNAGLTGVSGAVFRWASEISERLLFQHDNTFSTLLAKVFLLMEDSSVIQVLSEGRLLEMLDKDNRIYFDLSRNDTRLNISLGEQRKQPDMLHHLQRMPNLLRSVQKSDPSILEHYRVLLIHHATSEVLGFVKALEVAKCPAVTTLFIRYRGIVPDALLDDMLSMPENYFHFYGLQRVELRDSIGGAYILSRQYSPIDNLGPLDVALRVLKGGYFESMKFVSLHFFFKEAFQAIHEGKQLLLIEDGGYVAPVLNRLCYEGKTVGQVMKECEFAAPEGVSAQTIESTLLQDWLKTVAPATFEHTANGYYQLRDVEAETGGLRIPSFTIALSKYKNVVEAESCAYSILNAVQSIFYGLGKCIMYRHALILGSRGNIGSYLFKSVEAQVTYGSASGLDLAVEEASSDAQEFSNIQDMPEAMWRSLDLFIGMTGVSVLKQPFFEKLIMQGGARELFFASGSTKTIEFADLTDWLGELARSVAPSIQGQPVILETSPIKDPQGNLLQGHRVRIIFSHPEAIAGLSPEHPHKDIYMLGDSMPINFLYYGVPCEVIDGVFEELFSLIAGVASALHQKQHFAPEIFAIDVNIDKHAQRKSS